MKKLMVMAAAAILGSAAFGAAVSWDLNQGEDPLYAAGTYVGSDNKGTPVTSGTLYLFYSSYAQSSLYDALKSGTTLASLAGTYGVKAANGTDTFSTTLGTSGTFANTTFVANETSGKASLYEVVMVGDKYWIGKEGEYSWNDLTGGIVSPSWSATGRTTRNHLSETSYSSQGWYTAAVPEPTSGLLLLLGVAGLALRRRRA